jgi:predicted ATPase
MLIKKIEVENFRSFKKLSINPNQFNVLIGPNASGKTNFLQIFRFARDIVNLGLKNAISMQGGVDYLRNIHIGKNCKQTKFSLEILHRNPTTGIKQINNKTIKIKPEKLLTNFVIEYTNDKNEFFVKEDNLVQEFTFFEVFDDSISRHCEQKAWQSTVDCHAEAARNDGKEKFVRNDNSNEIVGARSARPIERKGRQTLPLQVEIGKGTLEFHRNENEISKKFTSNENLNITIDDIVPPTFVEPNSQSKTLAKNLFLENSYYFLQTDSVYKMLSELSVYDLDPLQGSSVSSVAGRTQLEENGENIAIVLKRILNCEENTRQFFNFIRHVLPFVEDIEVERFLDKHLQIKVKEKYTPNEFVPASLMSNGSVTLISIIIALYFENKKISVFEEPGGKVHPYLISKIIEMMKDASEQTQIFLTTHNPEIVKYAGLENIFYLLRDSDGYSVISHLSTKEEIAEFMKNEIGIEELFVQNLLSK